MQMKLPKFKIRCSAIGKIMTNPKGKSETLSKTCMSYLDLWIKEHIYGRRKEITSKYMEKGNIVEQDSLDFIAKHLGLGMLIKNDRYFEDEFLTGEPDAIPKDWVIDTKASWDFSTFPLLETELSNKDYEWQIKGYCHLTGKKQGKVIYTLMDCPEHLIISEAKSYSWRQGYGELTDEMFEEFKKKMTYSDIPEKLKIKVFDINYDESFIESVINRVEECREYINKISALI